MNEDKKFNKNNWPQVTVQNKTSFGIVIDGDPNWDDQRLLINGKYKQNILLKEGEFAILSVKWDAEPDELMMGVEYTKAGSNSAEGLQQEIGQNSETGNLGVSDSNWWAKKWAKFTQLDQNPLSFTLVFEDI